eukprot:5107117-Amphidinium_carterae.1
MVLLPKTPDTISPYHTTPSKGKYSRINTVLARTGNAQEVEGYPLDEFESITGHKKWIFLNELFVVGVSTPGRAALKLDLDIDTLHDNVATYISYASAVACAGGHATAAYQYGLTYVAVEWALAEKVSCSAEAFAAWATAPISESGIGVPTLHHFFCGGDTDQKYAWRDAICRAADSDRIPWAFLATRGARAYPSASHAEEWDELRKAGEVGMADLIANVVEAGDIIDAVTSASSAMTMPDPIVDSMVAKFATTGAAAMVLPGNKVIWSVARLCAQTSLENRGPRTVLASSLWPMLSQ